jgi:hypothetical protein
MSQLIFPPLVLSEWKETRDTLQKYCRMVGAIREVMSQPLLYSLHTNLLIGNKGFTTSLLSKNISSPDQTFEVIIDLENTRLIIESSYREPLKIALTGQSLNALCDETCSELVDIGVQPPLEKPSFLEGTRGRFDKEPLKNYWDAVTSVNQLMNKIKSELLEETSPIQLRPDDLSLILIWFYKGIIDKEFSNGQQIEFGFSTGDEFFPNTHFYISTFPETVLIEKLIDKKFIVRDSRRNHKAIFQYNLLSEDSNAEKTLTDFYRRAVTSSAK